MITPPNLPLAQRTAHLALLTWGAHHPARMETLLPRMPFIRLMTREKAAQLTGMQDVLAQAFHLGEAYTLRQGQRWIIIYRRGPRANAALAHELGHVLLGHEGKLHAEEIEAEHFARCILNPSGPEMERWLRWERRRAEDIRLYNRARAQEIGLARGTPRDCEGVWPELPQGEAVLPGDFPQRTDARESLPEMWWTQLPGEDPCAGCDGAACRRLYARHQGLSAGEIWDIWRSAANGCRALRWGNWAPESAKKPPQAENAQKNAENQKEI